MKSIRSVLPAAGLLLVAVWGWGCARTTEKGSVTELDPDSVLTTAFTYRPETGAWEYRGTQPAVILFYESGNDSSRMQLEALSAVSSGYRGRVDFFRADVGAAGALSGRLHVGSLPVLLFAPLQGMPTAVTGFRTEEELKAAIARYLLPGE